MSQRKAVTKTIATRYKRSNRGAKKIILDELCAITLSMNSTSMMQPRLSCSPSPLPPLIAAAKQSEENSTLAGDRHTKPDSLLKDSIPMRTWADWDDHRPGFVEIYLVGHEGGNSRGDFCFTVDITDIATGWTEARTVKNKAQKWVFAAVKDALANFPFPITGIDSDKAVGVRLVRKACDEPLRWIAENAGLEGYVVVSKVRAMKSHEGFNAATDVYGDLTKDGVIDPVKVTRSALANAASIAAMFITTEAVVYEKPEESESDSGGSGHSHGPGGHSH